MGQQGRWLKVFSFYGSGIDPQVIQKRIDGWAKKILIV